MTQTVEGTSSLYVPKNPAAIHQASYIVKGSEGLLAIFFGEDVAIPIKEHYEIEVVRGEEGSGQVGLMIDKCMIIPLDGEAVSHLTQIEAEDVYISVALLMPGNLHGKVLFSLNLSHPELAKLEAYYEMLGEGVAVV